MRRNVTYAGMRHAPDRLWTIRAAILTYASLRGGWMDAVTEGGAHDVSN